MPTWPSRSRNTALHVKLCESCLLAQLSTDVSPKVLFSDYAYFSSFSESWVRHAADFAAMAARRFKLNGSSQVVEIASNDGYLLKHFKALRVPVLGIEPAANIAQAAVAGRAFRPRSASSAARRAAELAGRGIKADLIVGNNVFAHVPELNDFVGGFPILLKPDGVLSLEFPHLLRLMLGVQFDTIYHEHFSYFSFLAAERVLAAHGLRVFDVKELATHGGSLRVFACHRDVRQAHGKLGQRAAPRRAGRRPDAPRDVRALRRPRSSIAAAA